MEYYNGTKDSIHIGNKTTATPSELTEIIKTKNYNRYNGGELHSRQATIDYYKQGFIYKDHIVINGTESEFKELEELIHDRIDYFTPRQYPNF